MSVEYRKVITRQDLKNEPYKIFLFGDNLCRIGMGGQAGAMRGEPNAVGIPTKKHPSHREFAYFNDDEYEINIKHIDEAFLDIGGNKNIVIPEDGLGTGLAQLPTRAPKTYQYILFKIAALEKLYGKA